MSIQAVVAFPRNPYQFQRAHPFSIPILDTIVFPRKNSMIWHELTSADLAHKLVDIGNTNVHRSDVPTPYTLAEESLPE